jgi:hypothetical protein
MAAALSRPEDVERLPALRQILKLEADPARLVEAEARRAPTPEELARERPSGDHIHIDRATRGPGAGR